MADPMQLLHDRFHRDSLIALATTDGLIPSVRTVDAFYERGSFYTITHGLSGKMQQIAVNPNVAVCGDWFTGHAVAESLGHTNEADPNTIILRLRLTDGVLFADGVRYELKF